MITPTVGRMVYFKESEGGLVVDRAAVITNVHNATCVDLCVMSPYGVFNTGSICQGSDPGAWDWMPFQKGQAAKTEQLESELRAAKEQA